MSLTTNGVPGLSPQVGMDQSHMISAVGGAGLSALGLPGGQVGRFEAALDGASVVQSVQYAQVQQVGSMTDAVPLTKVNSNPSATSPTNSADAANRAVRGLDLGDETDGPGESILQGLGRLRSVFDTQTKNVAAVNEGNVMDAVTMMNLQTEIVRYTVLIDVSSKLAGKSTQALDALMKGQ